MAHGIKNRENKAMVLYGTWLKHLIFLSCGPNPWDNKLATCTGLEQKTLRTRAGIVHIRNTIPTKGEKTNNHFHLKNKATL
jgi:hypothetical protein